MKDIWDLDEVVRRIASFTGEPEAVVRERLSEGERLSALEWNRRNPKTQAEIDAFYRETPWYVYDLAWWHLQEPSRSRFPKILEWCRKLGDPAILDFGAGIGSLDVYLTKNGLTKVHYYDVEGVTKKFAKFSFHYCKADVKVLDEVKPPQRYDALVLLDVLEHLTDPLNKLWELEGYLNKKAIIFLANPFEHTEEHPCHLVSNEKYLGADVGFLAAKGYTARAEEGMYVLARGLVGE